MPNYHTNKRPEVPPVQERPRCKGCGKPHSVRFDKDSRWVQGKGMEHTYTGRWWYQGAGWFCTNDCAVRYANRLLSRAAGGRRGPCGQMRGESGEVIA